MTATILDGKAFAAGLRARIFEKVSEIKNDHGFTPGLAVVLVGENPASEVYVRNKGKQTLECGMESFEHKLPDTTSQEELLALVEKLNADQPNTLLRRGINKQSLTIGTIIVVDGYQSKDRSNRANGRDITFADGRKLFLGSSGTGAPRDGADPRERKRD